MLQMAKQRHVTALRKAAAAAERERYKKRKAAELHAPPPARAKYVRLGRTFSSSGSSAGKLKMACESGSSTTNGALKRRKRLALTSAMEQTIVRINRKRQFKRHDIVNGEKLNRIEWSRACRDFKELRKVSALAVYIRHPDWVSTGGAAVTTCVSRKGCGAEPRDKKIDDL